jgi:hypothetical protein
MMLVGTPCLYSSLYHQRTFLKLCVARLKSSVVVVDGYCDLSRRIERNSIVQLFLMWPEFRTSFGWISRIPLRRNSFAFFLMFHRFGQTRVQCFLHLARSYLSLTSYSDPVVVCRQISKSYPRLISFRFG